MPGILAHPVKSIVLIYSGGLDSTVLMYKLHNEGFTVLPLSFNYGQRHQKELGSAVAITQRLGLRHEIANLQGITHLLKGSSQTDPSVPVPHGHYTAETMKLTVVPNRNMIMLSVAAALAVAEGIRDVGYGAHAGDHAIYPDCRQPFVDAMSEAFFVANEHKLWLHAPFLQMTKAEIVQLGNQLHVPFEKTWSCYEGGELHCGLCGTCVERIEAFDNAGVVDPTQYAKRN